jgi:hypothetical protein
MQNEVTDLLDGLVCNMLHIFQSDSMEQVFLEKLIVTPLVNKFPTFYGTQRFITMFTTACHCSLS